MKTEYLQKIAIHALEDLKAIDLTILDVRELTIITDIMIICTGRSNRHVVSLAQNVVTEAKKNHLSFINIEGEDSGDWVIVDLGDVVVHIMQAETRNFYNLEDLWNPDAHTYHRHRK